MKKSVVAAVAFVAMTGSALADPFASFYGNSVQLIMSDGTKMYFFINQDMTYEQHFADGSISKGTYAWKDSETACFTQTAPVPSSPANATTCYDHQTDHKVGDSWSVTGADGKVITLTLIAGR
jgi:hypothetical protein